jgi:hypothetical protein
MRSVFGITLALVLAMFVSGCSFLGTKRIKNKKGKDKAVTQPAQTEVIGVVAMVNPEQNYVLIQCAKPPTFSSGIEFVSVNAAGAESRLVVTPEYKGLYVTADIKSGTPQAGNQVLRRAAPAAAPATAAVPTPAPAPAAAPPPPPPKSGFAMPALPQLFKPSGGPATEPPLPQRANENERATPAGTPTFEPIVR